MTSRPRLRLLAMVAGLTMTITGAGVPAPKLAAALAAAREKLEADPTTLNMAQVYVSKGRVVVQLIAAQSALTVDLAGRPLA